MTIELSESETTVIERVERDLRIWRYGRWLQIAAGLALFGYGIAQSEGFQPALQVIHPSLICIFGSVLAGNAIWDRQGKERQLLLKLFRASKARAA